MADEGVASRSLAAVDDVTDLRHVVVSAHFDVAVFTSTTRWTVDCRNYLIVAWPVEIIAEVQAIIQW